jgi:hypothetical protein
VILNLLGGTDKIARIEEALAVIDRIETDMASSVWEDVASSPIEEKVKILSNPFSMSKALVLTSQTCLKKRDLHC